MNLEQRIIDLEMLFARQERLCDDLSAEILRLNQRLDTLTRHLRRLEERTPFTPPAEEVPPPHY